MVKLEVKVEVEILRGYPRKRRRDHTFRLC
jgi:hypothetical protein